ncbi:hypothetical protein DFJ74DRAFT_708876 [Hyaloraphidium curvatum]|nr:hypothetical protein DFJ74DRAFT_708876 [Hyaloraphidium curvatum]
MARPHWTPEHATLLGNFTSPNDLEHFLATDYTSDLSEATKLRLWCIDDKLFNHGESVFDQWFDVLPQQRDAHIYIPYRSSSMAEVVVQALDSAKLANAVATGAPASAPLPNGSASEAAPDGAAGGAPKRRRETEDPASEIDHTLGKRLPMRIPAVYDNSVNLLLATRFLEKMVEEAIRAGLPFELILMDVNMPVIDGLTP